MPADAIRLPMRPTTLERFKETPAIAGLFCVAGRKMFNRGFPCGLRDCNPLLTTIGAGYGLERGRYAP